MNDRSRFKKSNVVVLIAFVAFLLNSTINKQGSAYFYRYLLKICSADAFGKDHRNLRDQLQGLTGWTTVVFIV